MEPVHRTLCALGGGQHAVVSCQYLEVTVTVLHSVTLTSLHATAQVQMFLTDHTAALHHRADTTLNIFYTVMLI